LAPTGRAADEASPANAEATAAIVTERRKRGPTRDFETALKVDGVITRLAPDGNWRARLEDSCEGLTKSVAQSRGNKKAIRPFSPAANWHYAVNRAAWSDSGIM
jgi:hypothetical protein